MATGTTECNQHNLTERLIWMREQLGLAGDIKEFNEHEIEKGRLANAKEAKIEPEKERSARNPLIDLRKLGDVFKLRYVLSARSGRKVFGQRCDAVLFCGRDTPYSLEFILLYYVQEEENST